MTAILLLIPEIAMSASIINGDAGFKLGELIDTSKLAAEKLILGGDTVYKVKPLSAEKSVDYVLLRITRNNRVHRITVMSPAMSSSQCYDEKESRRKAVEKEYPSLGYYAMDEAELFYEDPRTLTIECVTLDGKTRLKTEYSDDALAAE